MSQRLPTIDDVASWFRESGQTSWFEKYRWVRNQMADLGEGDMRLYVPDINSLFSVPIHCEWALQDRD